MRGFRSTGLLKANLHKIAIFAGESVMYAVVETGGKQYRVAVGDVLRVEKLDVAEGGAVNLDKVLMVADGDSVRVGTPNLAGSAVTATVKAHGRGDKIRIFKFRRRKHYRKSQGHRQHYTEIEITAIS
jgi:large subunit ribosomal protein L21